MGRQPWIVFGLLHDRRAGVSPGVSSGEVLTSLVVFTLLYGVLAVIEVGLLVKYVKIGPPADRARPDAAHGRRRRPRRRPAAGLRVLSRRRLDSHGAHRPSGSCLIAVLWIGYFVLEGFDFGVGILLPVLGRDETERRVLINTIGPVWDGNEVWLLAAGGATFAAFPEWYATLFSGFYLPLLLILVALIVRGVAFEYRGKRHERRAGGARWDAAIFVGSLAAGAAVGRGVRATSCAGVPHRRRASEYIGQLLRPAQPVRPARRPGHARPCSSPTARCSSRSRPTARSGTRATRAGRSGWGWSPPCWRWLFLVLDARSDQRRRPRAWSRSLAAVLRWSVRWRPNQVGREGWAFAVHRASTIAGRGGDALRCAVPQRHAVAR